MHLPYFSTRIPAGFAQVMQGEESEPLDVRSFLLTHPLSTYFFRLQQAVPAEKLLRGDVLVVDRAQNADRHSLVLGTVNGEFHVCRGHQAEGLEVWGVVVSMMRRL